MRSFIIEFHRWDSVRLVRDYFEIKAVLGFVSVIALRGRYSDRWIDGRQKTEDRISRDDIKVVAGRHD